MNKYRNIDKFMSLDGDEAVMVRNAGNSKTNLTTKIRVKFNANVRRHHQKFLQILVDNFGDQPFRRWDLDAARISWLLEKEINYSGLGEPTPSSLNQLLVLDFDKIAENFPEVDLYK